MENSYRIRYDYEDYLFCSHNFITWSGNLFNVTKLAFARFEQCSTCRGKEYSSFSKNYFFRCILLFQKIIFSDAPPLKEEMNSCIYLFNGATDSISANIGRQYNIPNDFEYSLVGLLLQYKKEIFSLLKSDYRIIIAQIYSETPSKFHTIPYVRIVSKGPKRGVASENILFPTTLITGALYVEKIQINNIPLLELLEISPEGKILNPELEKRFLEDVAKLSHKDDENNASLLGIATSEKT